MLNNNADLHGESGGAAPKQPPNLLTAISAVTPISPLLGAGSSHVVKKVLLWPRSKINEYLTALPPSESQNRVSRSSVALLIRSSQPRGRKGASILAP